MAKPDDVVMAVVDRNMRAICSLGTKDQMVEAAQYSIALSVALMRAERGDEFVDGFLTAAIEDPLRVTVVPAHPIQ